MQAAQGRPCFRVQWRASPPLQTLQAPTLQFFVDCMIVDFAAALPFVSLLLRQVALTCRRVVVAEKSGAMDIEQRFEPPPC